MICSSKLRHRKLRLKFAKDNQLMFYFHFKGSAPEIFHKMLRSAYFRLLVMGVVLANGIITATMNFKHDGNPRESFYQKYYYIEVMLFLNLYLFPIQ